MPTKRFLEIRAGFHPRSRLSHAVFDFDGTLSWLRHGWPEMMRQLFFEYLPATAKTSVGSVGELLLHDILSLNGKPSIHQMRLGAERIQLWGGVSPKPERLLEEYQRRLDAAIVERTRRIEDGRADPDVFVVHGARAFLERLRDLGLKLVILSGTQQDRVREEAALLNLAGFFGPHIYGGTADVAQSDKRAVIQRLLKEEEVPGACLLCIGDGPVELRLAKEAGGVALGVASDEDHNGSGKVHPQKLAQLRDAGADVLIPDYGDLEALLKAVLG